MDAVDTPETDSVVRSVVEKSGFIQIRAHGETVNLPGADASFYFETVEAQTHVGAFSNIDQPPGAILHLMSSGADFDPAACVRSSYLEKCGLKVELLFID